MKVHEIICFMKVWWPFISAKSLDSLNPTVSNGSQNSLFRIPISSQLFFVWPFSQYCRSTHFSAWKTSFSTREVNLFLISGIITAIAPDQSSKTSWRLFMAKKASSTSTPAYLQLLTFFIMSSSLILWYQCYKPISSLKVKLWRKPMKVLYTSSLEPVFLTTNDRGATCW